MATRSNIGILDSNGKVEAIYVHYDGYPSGVGKMINDNYYQTDKIEDLIDLGGVSFLAPEITKPEGHSFNSPVKGYTVFYGRDRGEEGMESQTYDSIEDLMNQGNDYIYIYNDDKDKWFWVDNWSDDKVIQDLSKTDFDKYEKGGEVKGLEKYGSFYYLDKDGDLFGRPMDFRYSMSNPPKFDLDDDEWYGVSEEAFNEKERKEFDRDMEKLFGKKVDFAKGGKVKKGNEMIVGGLAGIVFGFLLNK